MRIAFTPASLDTEKWFPAYDVLISIIENYRHGIDPTGVPQIFASRWLANRPRSLRDLIRGLVQARSTTSGIDRTRVLIDIAGTAGGSIDFVSATASLTPLDAIAYLSAPFHVIVENEAYDGAFLLWMAKAVGFDKLVHAYRKGVFIFRHAGGKSGMQRSAEVLTAGVIPGARPQHGAAMRLWAAAFLDSDSRHPGDTPNQDVIEQTEPHVMLIRQLARRSIENYIPEHYLLAYRLSKEHKRKVSALVRLTELQRRHFHLKVGFKHNKKGSRTKASYMSSGNVTKAEKLLFNDVSEGDFYTLGLGFGDGLSEIFRDARFQSSGNDKRMTNQVDRNEISELCKALFERF